MPRAKTGVVRRRRHNKIRKMVKGQWGSRGTLFRRSNEAMLKSLWYSYRDRKVRAREMRKLWIQRINAAARMNDITYNRLIHGLRLAEIDVDRKILAELAVNDFAAFSALCEAAKAALPEDVNAPRVAA